MTVAELIEQLKQLAPDSRVVVRHWNASYDFENIELLPVRIQRHVKPGWDSGGLFADIEKEQKYTSTFRPEKYCGDIEDAICIDHGDRD